VDKQKVIDNVTKIMNEDPSPEFDYQKMVLIAPHQRMLPYELQPENYVQKYFVMHKKDSGKSEYESSQLGFTIVMKTKDELITYKEFFKWMNEKEVENLNIGQACSKVAKYCRRGRGNTFIKFGDKVLVTFRGSSDFDAGAFSMDDGVLLNKDWEGYFVVIPFRKEEWAPLEYFEKSKLEPISLEI